MKKIKIILSLAIILDLVLSALFYVLAKSFFIPIILNSVLALFIFIFLILNFLLKKTSWYKTLFVDYNHSVYPDNKWYRFHAERNFDLVVLGSTSAKYNYDFSDQEIKAMNFAQAPQTLIYDFKLLKNFHSILRENGIVLINIMPFTSINKKTGLLDELKYSLSLSKLLIEPKYRIKVKILQKFPIFIFVKQIKRIIKSLIQKDMKIVQKTCDFENDSKSRIKHWQKEFGINDLNASLTDENKKGREIRIQLMQNLIDFCQERNYKPVFVIMPLQSNLLKEFTTEFRKEYIYNYIQEINRDILLLDYLDNEEVFHKELFENCIVLNSKGKKIFTSKLVNDLIGNHLL